MSPALQELGAACGCVTMCCSQEWCYDAKLFKLLSRVAERDASRLKHLNAARENEDLPEI